ncbi:Monothiol glutaredoxin-S11 [Apostasia shenzhenica]|uniref:Monothiol glutaredoxin-S11 n=1 Tax=Apostasia shenzhenica TaxID=1088818 RepID=A0A2H9ZRI2_9ASPA|nr:Monothiol glutaredoxin-S11 [Apostasia shenzhenica]
MGVVREVQSKEELDATIGGGAPAIIHFWASWCEASKQMDQVFAHLCTDFPHVLFLREGRRLLLLFSLPSLPLLLPTHNNKGGLLLLLSLLPGLPFLLLLLSPVTAVWLGGDWRVRNTESRHERQNRGRERETVEAEEQPEISDFYAVSAVPYFVLCKDGRTFDILEGANPSSLANKVAKIAGSVENVKSTTPASLGLAAGPTVIELAKEVAKHNDTSKTETTSSSLTDTLMKQLQQLVNSHPVFLFMKGTPDQPKCKFSRKVVEILKNEGVEFRSFDILSDNDVRDGMKKFSNWPTFPQLFCNCELLGGCDIVVAMHESGELKKVLRDHKISLSKKDQPSSVIHQSHVSSDTDSKGLNLTLTSRLESLVSASPVMLFMKGKSEEPKCGFSNKVVELLKHEKVEFQSFDVLSDDEVRQGLKVFSNWSSYPQLYIKGELIGGSDIILEMHKSGEFEKLLIEKGIVRKEAIEERLRRLISSSPVMLFMKGTPNAPCCGFSSKVVNALREEGIEFGSFDILSDEEARQGLKTYSNWPTFPQLYYHGDLIGGCDIVLELQKNSELKLTLSE